MTKAPCWQGGKLMTAHTILTVPEKHQFKIAKDTLRMSDAGALIMGGMTKVEAREFLHERVGWSEARIAEWENGS